MDNSGKNQRFDEERVANDGKIVLLLDFWLIELNSFFEKNQYGLFLLQEGGEDSKKDNTDTDDQRRQKEGATQ
jgi:hypothetical protein